MRQRRLGGLAVVAVIAMGCEVPEPTAEHLLGATPIADNQMTTETCEYSDSFGDQTLEMDVYVPDGAVGPLRTAVYFHGGGWADDGLAIPGSSVIDTSPAAAERIGGAVLAQLNRGWAVVSANYRLTNVVVGGATPAENQWPAQVIDAKAAVNCAKSLPIVDGERVVVAGSSAGGHLATMVKLTPGTNEPGPASSLGGGSLDGDGGLSTDVRAAVSLDGPMRLDSLMMSSFLAPYVEHLLCGDSPAPAGCVIAPLIAAASPITHATSDASVYLACGHTPVYGNGIDLGPGLRDCADHIAYYDAAGYGYGVDPTTDGADAVYIDRTDRIGGNHFNIDTHLHLSALEWFLQASTN